MRCPTCGYTKHPGYVAWRDVDLGNGLFRRSLAPCPECGGSVVVSGCEGTGEALETTPRPYRYYLLDDRGMIYLAEIVDSESDDEARRHAAHLLDRHTASSAVEVWDVRRSVDVARRDRGPGRP